MYGLNALDFIWDIYMDLDALNTKLKGIQDSLDAQETTLKDLHKDLSENQNLHSFEKEELRRDYQTFLNDYEYAYDVANQQYKESIEGLSEAYLSMCPFYKGPNLPKQTFLDSKADVADLYALFMIMGLAHMYGIQ